MPSLQVQTYTLSQGIELSFTDSGAPSDSVDYTTVVFLHGGIFNAYQFYKLHAHAHPLNLRTVFLHRRDYAGSTPYSRTELDELEQGSVEFWERLSAQLAEFLGMFIQREKIPNSVEGRGGLAIFGWSAGCATILSVLGAVQNPLINEELYKDLQEYLAKCILYGRSHEFFGYTPPDDNPNYIPWHDPAVSVKDLPLAVAEWVSSYYDHPCYDPLSQSLPSTATIYDLDGKKKKSDLMSISTWSEEDFAKGLEGPPAKGELLA
ncbi:hypothetical protein EV360DRAFT_49359 [Lentinula raphanica]|nr:hypothetical protein EV360DRAFT_49359 [Lentinula raphanica]